MELLVIVGVAVVAWLFVKGQADASAGKVPSVPAAPPDNSPVPDAGSGSQSVVSYFPSLDAIAAAVARAESGNRQTDASGNTIISSAGAIGVMQLEPATAAQLGVNPYDEAQNRAGGATYLQQLYDKYGNLHDALGAYEWGPGHVDRALASGSSFPASTESYITKIEGFLAEAL